MAESGPARSSMRSCPERRARLEPLCAIYTARVPRRTSARASARGALQVAVLPQGVRVAELGPDSARGVRRTDRCSRTSTRRMITSAPRGWVELNDETDPKIVSRLTHVTDRSQFMILPIHRLVRARMAEAVSRLYSIPADDPAIADIPRRNCRRAARSATSPCRSPSTLARRLRKAPRVIAQELAGALGTDRRRRAHRGGAERLRQLLPRSRRTSPREWLSGRPAAAASARGQGHRRAHGDQSEQGGAHRPPAQRRARRRVRPAAPVPGPRRSRSRTTSTTPASRSPTSSSASASSSTRRSTTSARSPTPTRFDYYCWDLYAQVTEWYDGRTRARLKIRTAALHDIEHGGNDTADIAAFIADRIVRAT